MSGPSLSREPAPRGARRAGRIALLAGVALGGVAAAQTLSSAQKTAVDIFVARTSLPRGWVASVKPGLVVAIRDRDGLAARNPADRIHLVGEVVDEEAVDRLGYRSMRLAVEINCETRRDRVVEMEVFSSPNLKGQSQARTVPGGWVQPSDDAYMGDVLRAVCRAMPRLARDDTPPAAPPARPRIEAPPAKAAPVVVAAAAAPRPPAPKAPVREPPPAAVLAAPLPPRLPAPEEPIATGPRAPRLLADTEALPAFLRARPISPGPPPKTEAPAGAPRQSASAASASPAPVVVATAPAGLVAQVGALDSEADARRAIAGLKSFLDAGLSTRIQPVKLGQRTFYRAYVAGFASRAAANGFCARLASAGRPCMVR